MERFSTFFHNYNEPVLRDVNDQAYYFHCDKTLLHLPPLDTFRQQWEGDMTNKKEY
jgi:hypothetical protein